LEVGKNLGRKKESQVKARPCGRMVWLKEKGFGAEKGESDKKKKKAWDSKRERKKTWIGGGVRKNFNR